MFRRRTPLTLLRRLRGFVWPERGWRRGWHYVLHRVGRLPGTEYSIAGGFACGAAMSFTPFVGLHFVLSALLAWAVRANPIAAMIGTIVGNPWTFPFIWVWLFKAGRWLTGGTPAAGEGRVDFSELFGETLSATLRLDWGYVWETAMPVVWPMTVAALPTATVVWLATYGLMRPVVRRYRLSRARRRRARETGESAAGEDAAGLRPTKEGAS